MPDSPTGKRKSDEISSSDTDVSQTNISDTHEDESGTKAGLLTNSLDLHGADDSLEAEPIIFSPSPGTIQHFLPPRRLVVPEHHNVSPGEHRFVVGAKNRDGVPCPGCHSTYTTQKGKLFIKN